MPCQVIHTLCHQLSTLPIHSAQRVGDERLYLDLYPHPGKPTDASVIEVSAMRGYLHHHLGSPALPDRPVISINNLTPLASDYSGLSLFHCPEQGRVTAHLTKRPISQEAKAYLATLTQGRFDGERALVPVVDTSVPLSLFEDLFKMIRGRVLSHLG
jgi:hypothetical protein